MAVALAHRMFVSQSHYLTSSFGEEGQVEVEKVDGSSGTIACFQTKARFLKQNVRLQAPGYQLRALWGHAPTNQDDRQTRVEVVSHLTRQ